MVKKTRVHKTEVIKTERTSCFMRDYHVISSVLFEFLHQEANFIYGLVTPRKSPVSKHRWNKNKLPRRKIPTSISSRNCL